MGCWIRQAFAESDLLEGHGEPFSSYVLFSETSGIIFPRARHASSVSPAIGIIIPTLIDYRERSSYASFLDRASSPSSDAATM